jgi:hypothetical protein
MQRTTYPQQVSIHLANPVMQPQYGLPVLMTTIQVISNEAGAIGHPTQTVQPMIGADMNDDVLAAINASLATIGYKLGKIDA